MATLTTAALQRFTDYLDPGAGNVALEADWYMAWGTSTQAESVGDTALIAEAAETRVTTTATQATATQNQHVGSITATGSKTIAEIGLLTASTSGTLIIRHVFTGVPVVADDVIQGTFTITHS